MIFPKPLFRTRQPQIRTSCVRLNGFFSANYRALCSQSSCLLPRRLLLTHRARRFTFGSGFLAFSRDFTPSAVARYHRMGRIREVTKVCGDQGPPRDDCPQGVCGSHKRGSSILSRWNWLSRWSEWSLDGWLPRRRLERLLRADSGLEESLLQLRTLVETHRAGF